MAKVTGRRLPLSLPRRWIADLMRASRGRPIISFERVMHLAPLVAAREAHPISWSVLFAKAFSLLSVRRPALRQSFVGFPWPHLFESDNILASIAIERDYQGEPAVFFGLIRDSHTHALPVMQQGLDDWKTQPVNQIRQFRRMIFFSRLPWPVRRFLWWYAMNTSGLRRARNCGTFGVSSTAGSGAVALNLIAPVTCTLSLGPLADDGAMTVRLHFDHRVLDGMTAAKVLEELEASLNGEIADELESLNANVLESHQESVRCEFTP